MKLLQNKLTREIGCLVCSFGKTPEKITVVECIDGKRGSKVWYYNSLAELNEEWCDYEEQKGNWTIDPMNENYIDDGRYTAPDELERYEELGLKFNTEEEAEKAVEKLKAFKRLKDKGFSFDPVDRYEALCGNGFNIPITATMPPEAYTDTEVSKDLDICFGGEE